MRFRRRRKKSPEVAATGLQEAREARKQAERQLETDTREVIIPLREMHKVNHIGPLISSYIVRGQPRENR